MFTRRGFILTVGAGMLLPTFGFAQTYPAITRSQLDEALARVQAAHPKRFAELGEPTGKVQRRGNAIYVFYAEGRIRLLQETTGELRLPSQAVELESDPKPETGDDNSTNEGGGSDPGND